MTGRIVNVFFSSIWNNHFFIPTIKPIAAALINFCIGVIFDGDNETKLPFFTHFSRLYFPANCFNFLIKLSKKVPGFFAHNRVASLRAFGIAKTFFIAAGVRFQGVKIQLLLLLLRTCCFAICWLRYIWKEILYQWHFWILFNSLLFSKGHNLSVSNNYLWFMKVIISNYQIIFITNRIISSYKLQPWIFRTSFGAFTILELLPLKTNRWIRSDWWCPPTRWSEMAFGVL